MKFETDWRIPRITKYKSNKSPIFQEKFQVVVIRSFAVILALILISGGIPESSAQVPEVTKSDKVQRQIQAKEAAEKAKKAKEEQSKLAKDKQTQALNAEQITEVVIYAYGGRAGMAQIRKTELLRGKLTRYLPENKTEEISYEARVLRGESIEKDRLRLDQKSPTFDFAMVLNQNKVYGMLGDTVFQPRQELVRTFQTNLWRGIEALLRYKENGSTLKLLGKNTKMGVEFFTIEVTDKENRQTRFNISAKSYRVLSAEYEESLTEGATPAKYVRKFYDYRVAQGTLVPFRATLTENDVLTEENNILTVTYGIKIDENFFNETPPQS